MMVTESMREYGFEEVMESIRDLTAQSSAEAKEIIAEYYRWWAIQNKEALHLRIMGEDVNTGVVAPFFKVHTTNSKPYIHWVRWPRTTAEQRKVRMHTYAEMIAPWKRGYTEQQLSNYCQPWELQKVMETEQKLAVIRDVINLCHKTKTEINGLKRKHNKRENKNE